MSMTMKGFFKVPSGQVFGGDAPPAPELIDWENGTPLDVTTSTAVSWQQGSVSVSADGSTVSIGSLTYNTGGAVGGAAVYTWNGSSWDEVWVTAAGNVSGDQYGYSTTLSSDGNTLVVGARAGNSTAGKAYLFTRTAGVWTEQQTITAGDPAVDDYFGQTMELTDDGQHLFITSWWEGANNNGAVYYYDRSGNTFTQQQKIPPPVLGNNQYFGDFMSISEDGLTAAFSEYTTSTAAKVSVYTRSGTTWTHQDSIAPGTISNFGTGLSFSSNGDIMAVSANTSGANIYTRSGATWSLANSVAAGSIRSADMNPAATKLATTTFTEMTVHTGPGDGTFVVNPTTQVLTGSVGYLKMSNDANVVATLDYGGANNDFVITRMS